MHEYFSQGFGTSFLGAIAAHLPVPIILIFWEHFGSRSEALLYPLFMHCRWWSWHEDSKTETFYSNIFSAMFCGSEILLFLYIQLLIQCITKFNGSSFQFWNRYRQKMFYNWLEVSVQWKHLKVFRVLLWGVDDSLRWSNLRQFLLNFRNLHYV